MEQKAPKTQSIIRVSSISSEKKETLEFQGSLSSKYTIRDSNFDATEKSREIVVNP